MKKYKNILLDWDGTLAMTSKLWLDSYRHILDSMGYQFNDETIVKDFFYEHDKAEKKYLTIDFSKLHDQVYSYVAESVHKVDLFPDTVTFLRELKKKQYNLALVTSSIKALMDIELKQTNVRSYFQFIVHGDDVENPKPDPEPVLRALKKGSFKKSETIIVGDSRADILSGQAAGIATCAFLPEQNSNVHDFDEIVSHKPDYQINYLNDLFEII